MTQRKIAIVGTAPSSYQLAPYNDPTWEIWVLKLFAHVPRWDCFFEIHEHTEGKRRWPKEYWDFLCAEHLDESGKRKPLYSRGKVDEWPNSVAFPHEEVIAHYGTRYFTNQVSWMLALAAMQEGVTEIGLWGVDMAQHGVGGRSEYAHQRPSCEYFLGVANGKGIKTYVPPQSDLLKCRKLYGIDVDDFDAKVKTRHKELQGRVNEMRAKRERMSLSIAGHRGAIEELQKLRAMVQDESGEPLDRRIAELKQSLTATEQNAEVVRDNCHKLEGALEDTTWTMQWCQSGQADASTTGEMQCH